MTLLSGAANLEAQTLIEAPAVLLNASDQQKLDDRYTAYDAFSLHPMTVWAEAMNQGGDEVEIKLNLPDGQLWLQLKKSSIFAPNSVLSVSTATSQDWQLLSDDSVYRGYVDGDEQNFAIFMIRHDHFFGYYRKDGKIWTIGSIKHEGIDTDVSGEFTFVRYDDPKLVDSGACATTGEDEDPFTPEPNDGVTLREPFFFEIAYDVDRTMFERVKDELPSNATVNDVVLAIQQFLEKVTMRVEVIYREPVPSMSFHIVHVNIFNVAPSDDIYNDALSLAGHVTKAKGYWSANKTCIERDVVSAITGKNYGVAGVVLTNGIRSICGGTADDNCYSEPYQGVSFAAGTTQGAVRLIAHRVAHELTHNFGRTGHVNPDACGSLMHPGAWCG
jgi:Metallo-peptidase family M12B Reprolysin-like